MKHEARWRCGPAAVPWSGPANVEPTHGRHRRYLCVCHAYEPNVVCQYCTNRWENGRWANDVDYFVPPPDAEQPPEGGRSTDLFRRATPTPSGDLPETPGA